MNRREFCVKLHEDERENTHIVSLAAVVAVVQVFRDDSLDPLVLH